MKGILFNTSLIAPCSDYISVSPPVFYARIEQIAPFFTAALLGAVLGLIVALTIKKKFDKNINPLNIVIPAAISFLITLRFGFGAELIQGLIFCLLLLYAANSDFYTREVQDNISVMIIITAFIGTKMTDIPEMLAAAVLIAIPQIAVAVIKPESYGGADIKLTAAGAFLLGIERGLFAIVLGLSVALITTVIRRKFKKESLKISFAMIPYLAIGCMTAFFI